MTEPPSGSKGVALTNWMVSKAAGLLERKSSRRGFILGSAMVGSAVAVAGCAPGTTPGTPYNHITDCGGGLCTDGYTEFCCTINNGLNACPPGSFAGGWWRADYSSFCNGTRYYIDCMQNCCGPDLGNGFCAGCVECTCGGGCDTRRIYCNYFRYGQCHQEIGISGPIACRVVTCTPPYNVAEFACSTALAVDNSTAEHNSAHPCVVPPPPFLPGGVLPLTGAAVVPAAGRVAVFGRQPDSAIAYREFDGSAWGPITSVGPSIDSGLSAVASGPNVFLFGRGSADRAIWFNLRAGSAWTGWRSIGGNAFSDPSAVSDPSGIYVFVRGADDAIWYQRNIGGSWASAFGGLGGTVTSDPIAVADPAGVFVFVRGDDFALYYRRIVSGNAQPWAPLGGVGTSDCAAVSTPTGVQVFVRGGGGAIYHRTFSGGTPSPSWSPLGGVATSDPVAASHAAGVSVFVRGGDNAIWYRTLTSSWSPWATLGGTATSGPIVVNDSSGLYVIVRGADNGMWVNQLVSGTWSGWLSLGGQYQPLRAGR